ncbi:hypothetical protein [Fulvivirga sp. M361]|uniref:hypothetical protein n=1 Tax=Fulvivirga sp. M361 TaxID=2594266 RepID=UPI001629BF1E|nr:hypothetical protein [Fulvivirga sp. M361]
MDQVNGPFCPSFDDNLVDVQGITLREFRISNNGTLLHISTMDFGSICFDIEALKDPCN